MFGHDDDHDHDENNKPEDRQPHESGDQPAEEVVKPDTPNNDEGWQHPGPPPADESDEGTGDGGSDDKPEEAAHDDHPPAPFSLGSDDSDGHDQHDEHSENNGNELIDLKQEALGKLSPLVGHLEQSPDEKFRTLMMMIQASDNQDLVREAYETALKIDDEKERAQALLDIVNEINYFTQHSKNGAG